MSTLPLPVEPDYEEQGQHYISIGAENREKEFHASQALLALGASWIEVETAIELFGLPNLEPHQLTAWAAECLDRMSRNARQRKEG